MTSAECKENIPFLATKAGKTEYNDACGSQKYRSRRRFLKLCSIFFIFQIALLALNIIILVRSLKSVGCYQTYDTNPTEVERIYTPAESALQYKIEQLDFKTGTSLFTGEYSPEVDQAWSRLLRSSMIKISESELRRMNKTSIMLQDGSGYIGYLESIHMLHCVKRIYQSQHPDHYPELQGTEAFSSGHWDHCLEILRSGIMCNADLTVNTYYWKTPDEIQGSRSGARKCTDWSRIQDWADERAVKFDGVNKFLETLVHNDVIDGVDRGHSAEGA